MVHELRILPALLLQSVYKFTSHISSQAESAGVEAHGMNSCVLLVRLDIFKTGRPVIMTCRKTLVIVSFFAVPICSIDAYQRKLKQLICNYSFLYLTNSENNRTRTYPPDKY